MARLAAAVLASALFALAADPPAAHASPAAGRATAADLFARAEEAFTALKSDARLAIAYLYLDHYKDPATAWLRFRDVTASGRAGAAVDEARRQLAKLARYAPPESAAPPSSGESRTPPSPPLRASAPTAAPATPPVSPPVATRIRDIRHWSNPEYSRVVIDLDQKTHFYSNLLEDRSGEGLPPRLYIDLFNTLVEERLTKPIGVNDGILRSIRAGRYTPDSVRVVLDIDGLSTYRIFPMPDPFRIVIDVTGGTPAAVPDVAMASEPAEPLLPQAAPPPQR
jgi:N-acetylmuramoyl-L-alanine amidase